jgi:hypothetical protein
LSKCSKQKTNAVRVSNGAVLFFAGMLQKNSSVKIWQLAKNKFIFAAQNKFLNMLRKPLHIETKGFSRIGYNLCGACVSTN